MIIFYGMVPLDADGGESFAYPWRLTIECNEEEALDIAQGLALLDHPTSPRDEREHDERSSKWRTRLEARRSRVDRPVAFLRVGRSVLAERFVLVIRDSVSRVDVVDLLPYTAAAPDQNAERWPEILDGWATKLGIPVERRGIVGWFAVDSNEEY